MRASRLGLAAIAIAATAFPPVALAEKLVPPGNSAANQYVETFPTAGGAATGAGGKRSPAQELGARGARRLEAEGPEGRAAAALAAATAPPSLATAAGRNRGDGSARTGGESSRHPAEAGGPNDTSGSSGLGEVIGQATGSSPSGQVGVLLPLVIIGAVAGSAAYWWRRRRRPT